MSIPATAGKGTTFVETVTVTNHGPATALNVGTLLQTPAGTTIVNSGGGIELFGLVAWGRASLGPGDSLVYHVTLIANATQKHSVTTTALALALSSDPNLANNYAGRELLIS